MLQDAKMAAVIPVRDLSKARVFYEKMLGLVPMKVMDDMEQIVYSLNGTELLVYRTDAQPGEATKVGFEVSDVEQEMQDLRGHGIVFEDFDMPGLKTEKGMVQTPAGRAAWFKDLDGNYLVLTERIMQR